MQKKPLSFLGCFCVSVCVEKATDRLLLAIASVSRFPRRGLSSAGGGFHCAPGERERWDRRSQLN